MEGWKQSKYIKNLCFQKEVITFLNFIYGKKPVPISTINFLRGTEQPLHSDYIHFGSIPHKYLAAAWIALENTDYNNGTISVVPGSHKLDIVDYETFNLPTQQLIFHLKKKNRKKIFASALHFAN